MTRKPKNESQNAQTDKNEKNLSEQIFSRNRYPEKTHVAKNEYKIQDLPDNNQCSCHNNLNRNL